MSHGNPPYKQGSGKFTSLAYKLLDIAQKVIHIIPSVRRDAIKSESAHIRRENNANRTERPETASRHNWLGRDDRENRDWRNPGHDEAKDRQDPQRDRGSEGARGFDDARGADGSCQKGSRREVDVMAYSAIKIANRLREMSGGTLTPLQMLKLVYIAHGWSFAKFNKPLINEDVRAWQYGPVIPQLYRAINKYKANPITEVIAGDYDKSSIFSEDETLIRAVYDTYGKFSGGQLSSLTHREGSPWHQIWYKPDQNGIITQDIIANHYRELDQKQKTNL